MPQWLRTVEDRAFQRREKRIGDDTPDGRNSVGASGLKSAKTYRNVCDHTEGMKAARQLVRGGCRKARMASTNDTDDNRSKLRQISGNVHVPPPGYENGSNIAQTAVCRHQSSGRGIHGSKFWRER